MSVLLTASESATAALPSASDTEVNSILPMIKAGVTGVFDIASSAFNFLLSTPLSAFMIGAGFAFSALGLARKALKVAKRT